MSSSALQKDMQSLGTGTTMMFNNQVNDNSSTQNKTEYGSTTIGTTNSDTKVQKFADYS